MLVGSDCQVFADLGYELGLGFGGTSSGALGDTGR